MLGWRLQWRLRSWDLYRVDRRPRRRHITRLVSAVYRPGFLSPNVTYDRRAIADHSKWTIRPILQHTLVPLNQALMAFTRRARNRQKMVRPVGAKCIYGAVFLACKPPLIPDVQVENSEPLGRNNCSDRVQLTEDCFACLLDKPLTAHNSESSSVLAIMGRLDQSDTLHARYMSLATRTRCIHPTDPRESATDQSYEMLL